MYDDNSVRSLWKRLKGDAHGVLFYGDLRTAAQPGGASFADAVGGLLHIQYSRIGTVEASEWVENLSDSKRFRTTAPWIWCMCFEFHYIFPEPVPSSVTR